MERARIGVVVFAVTLLLTIGCDSDDAVVDAAVDSSLPAEDSATPGTDGSMVVMDSGTPVEDSGTPAEDSGTPAEDSGTPAEDSGTPAMDAGSPAMDAGSPAMDAGSPAMDAGAPATDAGAGVTVMQMSQGQFHGCALLSTGEIKCWGSNLRGQLGGMSTEMCASSPGSSGSTPCSTSPVTVPGISNAVVVAAGYEHTCALLSTGAVKCWGWNIFGQLGNATSTAAAGTAVEDVLGISAGTQLVSGAYHTCVMLGAGVACWGMGGFGRLGTATTATCSGAPCAPSPISLPSFAAQAIAPAGFHSCGIRTGGQVACWGANNVGQVGVTTSAMCDGRVCSPTPVDVTGVTASAMAMGIDHSCALLSTGGIQCWGTNAENELGAGIRALSSVSPVEVSTITDAVSVGAGLNHTCAVLSTGALSCWGQNSSGQLGDGTTMTPSTPVASTLSNVSTVSGGDNHTCALLTTGEVQCWGSNDLGQLGNGTMTHSLSPVTVTF